MMEIGKIEVTRQENDSRKLLHILEQIHSELVQIRVFLQNPLLTYKGQGEMTVDEDKIEVVRTASEILNKIYDAKYNKKE